MSKKTKTADGFPIELGKTYYFTTFDGQILPCTPVPKLNKLSMFEAEQGKLSIFETEQVKGMVEFIFIDPDDGGEVHRAMKPKEVYRSLVNLRKQGCQHCVQSNGFYCKKCRKPMPPTMDMVGA